MTMMNKALATVAMLALAAAAQAQPYYGPAGESAQPMITTRTVTTVTTTRNAAPMPQAAPMEGRVVYDGQHGPMPQQEEGHMFYPETHVWQATPGEFPRDWHHSNAAVYRHHARPVRAPQPVRVLTHHRMHEKVVAVANHNGPVPVMVQVVAPDGYRDTVPAVIRPSGVPTVVRATGANPPPVIYQVRSTEVGEPGMISPQSGPTSGERMNWAQERRQGMPQQGRWHYDQWDNDHWHDVPPPPPSDWDR